LYAGQTAEIDNCVLKNWIRSTLQGFDDGVKLTDIVSILWILEIYNTLVLPTFLYGSEKWTLTALQRRRIEAQNEVIETSERLNLLWPQNK